MAVGIGVLLGQVVMCMPVTSFPASLMQHSEEDEENAMWSKPLFWLQFGILKSAHGWPKMSTTGDATSTSATGDFIKQLHQGQSTMVTTLSTTLWS